MTEPTEQRWLVNDKTVWKKACRPAIAKIRYYLEGFLGGVGSVDWMGTYFLITLPGTPSQLHYDLDEFRPEPSRYTTREIHITFHSTNGLVVSCAVQDNFTLRTAEAISRMFYGIQGYADLALVENQENRS